MEIYNDVAKLICGKVDNIIDLKNLRLVCKSFNKQGKLYKDELTILDCIFISVDWCPHSRDCLDEWEKFTMVFNNKIKGNRVIRVIFHDHDGSSALIYGKRIKSYPTFIIDGVSYIFETRKRTCDVWSDVVMKSINNEIVY